MERLMGFKEYSNLIKSQYSNVGDLARKVADDGTFPDINNKKEIDDYVKENYSDELSRSFLSMWKSYIKYRSKLRANIASQRKSYVLPKGLVKDLEKFQEKNGFQFEVDALVFLLEKGLIE